MSVENDAVSPVGSTFESFLLEEGIRNQVYGEAIKRVFVYKIEEAIKARRMSKVAFAKQMGTSRTQVARILDEKNVGISLESMVVAAMSVGKKLKIDLVDG